MQRRTAARSVHRSEKRGIRPELGAAREKLVGRGLVYALVCEKQEDRIMRESELAEWRRGRRCGNGGTASRLARNARQDAFGGKRCVEKE